MERGQVLIIAVVFAALALFGLKVWSDRSNDEELTSGGRRVGDMARLGGSDDGDEYGGSGAAGGPGGARNGRAAGRLGDRNSGRPGSAAGGRMGEAGVIGGLGGPGRPGGLDRAGNGGSGGATGGSSGSGGTIGGATGSGEKGVQNARKNDLVDFLSSQPATAPEPEKQEGDESVALKLANTDDIGKQGGVDKDVSDADDGDGIVVGEDGRAQFPNNVSPDAAKFDLTVKPNWSGSDQTDNALIELRGEHDWSNRVQLVKNGEFLRFIVTDSSGKESDISYRISDWQAGDSHNIQAQYGPCENSPSNCTILSIDGRKVGENRYDASIQFPSNIPLFVGGSYQNGPYRGFNGLINVNITNPTFNNS